MTVKCSVAKDKFLSCIWHLHGRGFPSCSTVDPVGAKYVGNEGTFWFLQDLRAEEATERRRLLEIERAETEELRKKYEVRAGLEKKNPHPIAGCDEK